MDANTFGTTFKEQVSKANAKLTSELQKTKEMLASEIEQHSAQF
jgi:hypothetical protein